MKKVFIAFGAVVLTAAAVFAGRESMRRVPPTALFVQKPGVCKAIAGAINFTAATKLTQTPGTNPQARINTFTSGLNEYPLFTAQTSAAVCNTAIYVKP